MARTTREQRKISIFVEWCQEHHFIVVPIKWFILSFIGLYGVYEVLAYFEIKILENPIPPFIWFLCLSTILMLVRAIGHLLKCFPKPITDTNEYISNNDSLIEMMKEAESHSRWAEIIKIGSALSDVLWFTSRKKLRVAIGHFVQVAAQQSNDKYTLSATLIEDLGNTVMGLGRPDEGISYIKQGIKIAETENYPFLIMRGYRNLANCYSMKNDPISAEVQLTVATQATNNITNTAKKLEAFGAIEYARCKILKKQGKNTEAINALDAAIAYYDDLSNQFPDSKKQNNDRLVKIYREKGVIFLAMNNDESTDNAYDALMQGLQLAQETLNYDNIIRCCSLLAKIQIKRQAIEAAEGMVNIAKDCISKIDTPAIINEYNQIVRELELEKYAS